MQLDFEPGEIAVLVRALAILLEKLEGAAGVKQQQQKARAWTEEEDEIIRSVPPGTRNRWGILSKRLPNRTRSMIRSRWPRLEKKPEPPPSPPAELSPMSKTAAPGSTIDWSWTFKGPSKDKLMGGR